MIKDLQRFLNPRLSSMHVLLNAFHPNVHYQSKALLEDPHLNVVIIMSFQNKK